MPAPIVPGRVLRWEDGHTDTSLDAELRARPGHWAVVAANINEHDLARTRSEITLDSDEFEVDATPVHDDEYGLWFEIRARYVGRNGEHLPSWERDDD